MLTWYHVRFRTQLINKRVVKLQSYYCAVNIYIYIIARLKDQKKLKCPQCHQESDREFNASSNILFGSMSLLFRD